MSTAVLVACSKSKRDTKSPAYALYDSTLFEKSWTAAMYIGKPFVMSAEHNLLSAGDRVAPYDETLRGKTEDYKYHWAVETLQQLPHHFDTVVLLGGRDYVDPLIEAIEDSRRDLRVYDPYQYTSGNGQQMRVAERLSRAGYNGGTVEQIIEYGIEEYK